ncbi:GGDEF domain-containing protein [Azomonas macrocytogenes]|uniref:diguanylate cyclase n=1 Tax=Azomonas macrocytogenes TaxID=69962 RepID=A0A839T4X8_AZOMA|nr:GGDEF domain-containing protein [Azomonas macrocytogenes]MBB3103820.1 diguanylate cyclase [Azomonas macrocytogenes]
MKDDWKNKYLNSLDHQEAREKLWHARLDLLRRSLVRTSMAAEGNDRMVDGCMKELRDLLLHRNDLDAGLEELVPRLEKALLVSDRQREERLEQISRALRCLVEPLRQLSVASTTNRSLKRLARKLNGRIEQLDELQVLLHELSELQRQVLTPSPATDQARGGLLQRLFGGKLPAGASDVLPAPQATASIPDTAAAVEPVADASPVDTTDVVSADSKISVDAAPVPVEPSLGEALGYAATATLAPPLHDQSTQAVSLDESEYALPFNPEPAYGAVAEHIETTLLGLLEDLQLSAAEQPQVQAIRDRVLHGLNWYELAPLLDDLAVLLRGLFGFDPQAFEKQVGQLNQRLASTQDSLTIVHEGHCHASEVAAAFDCALREQAAGLHGCVRQATELAEVKQTVVARVSDLLQTVDAYQGRRREVEVQFGEQLQQLRERLSGIEQTAGKLRQSLEEQRHKALHDSLTGLPNRAALGDRLDLEVARWQRYGGDLLLAIMDIDHFKNINDTYGHLAGDKVLRIIASKWRLRLRKTDFIARYGGEEFVLLLPATTIEAGRQVLDDLRRGTEECPFHFKGERILVTVSTGLTFFGGQDVPERVFERADQALYRAKQAGRNRVELGWMPKQSARTSIDPPGIIEA